MKPFRLKYVLIFFLLFYRPPSGCGQRVIVSEIMYQPTGEQPEWIEIYNPTDSTVNLAGWEMSDSRSVFITLTDEDVQLPPKGLLVIAADASLPEFYTHEIEMIVPTGRFPGLNNSGDAIVLRDAKHSVVDSIYYETVWGNTPGISLERNWPADPIVWAESIAEQGATPGLPNSSWPVQLDLAVLSINFEPKVLRAPGKTVAITTVKNNGLEPLDSFELVLFYDWNENHQYETGDIDLGQFAGGFLAPGDSVKISVDVFADTAGTYPIGAEVICDHDGRTENDLSFSSFLAGYPTQSVIINEIMYRPNSEQCEWVEVYNPGLKSINLRHWKLWDKNFSRVAEIDSDFVITPNGFGIIAADSVFFTHIDAESLSVYVPKRFPVLNNDFDQIILHDFSGLTCDSVLYYDVWGGGNAVSLERVSVFLNPFQAGAWQACTDSSGATPGRVNSARSDYGLELDTLFYAPQPLLFGEQLQVSGQFVNVGQTSTQNRVVLFYDNACGDSVLLTPVVSEMLESLAPGNVTNFQVELPPSSGGIRWLFLKMEETGQKWGPFSFIAREAVGAVNINEFMAAPRKGEPEWIELFNKSRVSVAINGWTVQGESNELPIQNQTALLIPPRGFLILTGEEEFGECWPDCHCPVVNVGSSFPDLRNTTDQIVLLDAAGQKMDSLVYDETWPRSAGFSVEKTGADVPSGFRGNWAVCADFTGGTPCRVNSMNITDLPDKINLWTEPEIFSPDLIETVTIHFVLPVTTATVDLSIFDMRGRLIRTLLSLAPSGMQAEVAWDGRDIEGNMARMGIYVVFLEALSEIEGWHKTKTVPLVLAKEL